MKVKIIKWVAGMPETDTTEEIVEVIDGPEVGLTIPTNSPVNLLVGINRGGEIRDSGQTLLSQMQDHEATGEPHVIFHIPQYSRETILTMLVGTDAFVLASHGKPCTPKELLEDYTSQDYLLAYYVTVLPPAQQKLN